MREVNVPEKLQNKLSGPLLLLPVAAN